MVFELPRNLVGHPHYTLLDMMISIMLVPLDNRIRLAHIISLAVMHLHVICWLCLHKGIRSENIIVFARDGPQGIKSRDLRAEKFDLDEPYLSGFDYSRPQETESSPRVPFQPKNNIYRHPDR